jgi:hypothetical protein
LPPELVAGVTVVVVGEVAPGLAGGDFDELPQPASAATAITTTARLVNLRFIIAVLRSTLCYG